MVYYFLGPLDTSLVAAVIFAIMAVLKPWAILETWGLRAQLLILFIRRELNTAMV